MKTRKTCSAAAIVAVLFCSAAHAQVLGGGVGGAVNGTLGGGLRDTSVFSNGNAAGSFGGQLDTGSMIQRTRGAADQTTGRARNVGANVRNRARSTVATAHDTGVNTATSAASAAHTAKDQQTRSATNVAGATAAQLDATSVSQPQHPKSLDLPKLDNVATDANGSASGNASASRRGLAADVAADGSAAASASAKKEDAQE